MGQAKNGDTVRVRYTGILENGKAFANSKDGRPYEFTIGSGSVIPGIEKGIIGMKIGDIKTIRVPPEEAYGQKNKELIASVKKSDLPKNITPAIGCPLSNSLYLLFFILPVKFFQNKG